MKKRNMILGSAVLLAVLLVVGGTMAWFTAEADPVVNTFKAGTVDIELHDMTYEEGSEELIDFPVDGFTNVNPGDTYSKVVYVENIGSKRAYVRIKLTPEFEDMDNPDLNIVSYPISSDWVLQSDGWYYYKYEVDPEGFTSNIIDFVEFDGIGMDNDYQGKTFTLTVEAEAIQVTNGAALDLWGVDPSTL